MVSVVAITMSILRIKQVYVDILFYLNSQVLPLNIEGILGIDRLGKYLSAYML